MRHLLVLVLLAFCGCAIQRALEAQDAKEQLVGMSDEKILACMGPPHNRSAVGGTEVWQYGSGDNSTTAVGNANAWGGGMVTASVSTSSRYCMINIAMANHVVRSVNYSGPTGGLVTEGEQCAFAVKACLSQ
jgi:hypothetical protein